MEFNDFFKNNSLHRTIIFLRKYLSDNVYYIFGISNPNSLFRQFSSQINIIRKKLTLNKI